jgi:hypothetical protein
MESEGICHGGIILQLELEVNKMVQNQKAIFNKKKKIWRNIFFGPLFYFSSAAQGEVRRTRYPRNSIGVA